jgi:hypothetical protein
MNLGVKPFYQTTNPTQSQFYWGAHPYMTSIPELLATYNNVPNAPKTPWGATNSAVGGQSQLDVADFINKYITNPAYAGVNNATVGNLKELPLTPEQQALIAQLLSKR